MVDGGPGCGIVTEALRAQRNQVGGFGFQEKTYLSCNPLAASRRSAQGLMEIRLSLGILSTYSSRSVTTIPR